MPEDRGTMLQQLLVKIAPVLGLKPDEAGPLWDAVAARLKDAKAFFSGGQLMDGTELPGLRELFLQAQETSARLKVIEAKLVAVDGVKLKGGSK